MINIFVCTCPNRSGVGAIDNPDQFEQNFEPHYILEVPEKMFTHDISMVHRQKMLIFGVFEAFISKELVHFVKKLPEPNSSFTHKTKLKLSRYDYLKLRKKLSPKLEPFHQP